MNLTEKINFQLKKVIDPELGVNVLDLGLIYDIEQPSEGNIVITMTLTTPGCPLHDSITNGVKNQVETIEEINNVAVNLVWEPAWTPEHMSERAKQQLM